MKPEELKYNPSHEWVGVTEESGVKVGTVGITAFALEQLTDLVYMALPKVGQKVTTGQEFGEVESVKAVSPLYSPVTGEVVAVHSELVDRLESLAADPYGDGWIIKVKLADPSGLDSLLTFDQYQKQCAE
ncbi:MAG: glycine cleavage system protein GcvH [Pirellulaceae bacterium]|nr:glycine cleavage system protein GcvH [Pirellulaceae bacterium]